MKTPKDYPWVIDRNERAELLRKFRERGETNEGAIEELYVYNALKEEANIQVFNMMGGGGNRVYAEDLDEYDGFMSLGEYQARGALGDIEGANDSETFSEGVGALIANFSPRCTNWGRA